MDKREKDRYSRPAMDGYVKEMDRLYHKIAMRKMNETEKRLKSRTWICSAASFVGSILFTVCLIHKYLKRA